MKTAKTPEEKNDSNCEHLRNELFEYRVSIKSYIKSLNTIIICGTIVISILAFFGYNKIDNIQNIVLDKANKRLAQTDSILSQIDQSKIDSLNVVILNKENQLTETIVNFEKIIKQNELLESKLLSSLPENKRVQPSIKSYSIELQQDIINIKPFKKQVKENEKIFVYLVINENFELSNDCYLTTIVRPKNRRVIIQNRHFSIDSKFNKISFSIDYMFEKYEDYEVEIGLFRKEKSNFKLYYERFSVKLVK